MSCILVCQLFNKIFINQCYSQWDPKTIVFLILSNITGVCWTIIIHVSILVCSKSKCSEVDFHPVNILVYENTSWHLRCISKSSQCNQNKKNLLSWKLPAGKLQLSMSEMKHYWNKLLSNGKLIGTKRKHATNCFIVISLLRGCSKQIGWHCANCSFFLGWCSF